MVIEANGDEVLVPLSEVMNGESVFGRTWFVDQVNGNNNNSGLASDEAFSTIQQAVDASSPNDAIEVAQGFYDEQVVIARSHGALTIIGAGGRGSTGIESTGAGLIALTYHNDDLTLVNFGVSAESTANYAMTGTGSRLRTYGCKLEGVDNHGACLGVGPGSVANIGLNTAGKGSDILLVDTECAWAFNGLALIASDYGVPTEVFTQNCRFHNISNIHIIGVPGAFGIGSVRNFELKSGTHDRDENGNLPAKFIQLSGALDSGIIGDNYFAIATNAIAKFSIGAKMFWVANKTEAGSSTARPV